MVLAKVQDAIEAICKKVHSEGRDRAKKFALVWRFPWSLDHFHNLMRFSTEGCEDLHIKIPKDILEHLEKEDFFLGRPEGEKKFFLRKTRRNYLDYSEVKKDIFLKGNLRETPQSTQR